MRTRTAVSLTVSLTASGIALYLALRNVPLTDLFSYLLLIDYWWIIPTLVVILAIQILKAARWMLIIRSWGLAITLSRALQILMIAFMLNCILPGRIGELARPMMLIRENNFPFSSGIATVAAERVFDLVILLIFLICTLSIVTIDPALDITFGNIHLNSETLNRIVSGMVKLLFLLLAVLIFFGFEKTRKKTTEILLTISRRMPGSGTKLHSITGKTLEFIVRNINQFADGLSLFRSPKSLVFFLAISAVIWLCSALPYYLFAMGCPGVDLSFFQSLMVMVFICFFIALPSVPGFWGLWEAGGVFALTLLGIQGEAAAGFILTNHAVQLFPVIVIGLYSAMASSINIFQIKPENKQGI